MTRILTKKQKIEKLNEQRKSYLIKKVSSFCSVDAKEKRIAISHPKYNELQKLQRDYIGELKLKFSFYVQWELWEIPPGG